MKQQIRNHLISAFCCKEDEAEELADLALQTVRDHLQKTKEALGAMDLDRIDLTLHNFKGSLLNMGLADMAQEIEDVEKAFVSFGVDEAKRRLAIFSAHCLTSLDGHGANEV